MCVYLCPHVCVCMCVFCVSTCVCVCDIQMSDAMTFCLDIAEVCRNVRMCRAVLFLPHTLSSAISWRHISVKVGSGSLLS